MIIIIVILIVTIVVIVLSGSLAAAAISHCWSVQLFGYFFLHGHGHVREDAE